MRRKMLGVLAAVALAAAGTGALVSYVNGAEDRAMAGERRVGVLVVAQEIKQGTPTSAIGGKVALERVPAKIRAQGAVQSLTTLRGLVATTTLVPGEQVLTSRFAKPAEAAAAAAASTSGNASPSLLRISVELEAERVVGGTLRAGDTAAVFVSDKDSKVTRLLLHQVPVVAVYGGGALTASVAKSEEASSRAPSNVKILVTLAVGNDAAQGIVWGMEHGSIWLSQEPKTADQSNPAATTKGRLFP